MRIVHVVRQFHPAMGGLENFVLNLAEAQKKCGYDVSVVTLNKSFSCMEEVLPKNEIFNGIPVIRIPFFGSKRYPVALGIFNVIKPFDIVHVHAIDFFFDFLALTKFLHKKKLFCTTHGGFFHTNSYLIIKKIFFKVVTKFSSKAYQSIFSCSENDQYLFESITPNVKLIHNGVKPLVVEARERKNHIVCLGRLSQHKNIDKIVRVTKFLPEVKDLHLHVIGPDDDGQKELLEKAINDEGLSHLVTLHGRVDDEELSLYVSRAKIIISASDYEGFGLSIVEGMSAGLYPIMSDIPSFNGIKNKAGLGSIVDFSDIENVKRAIKGICELSANEFSQLSNECRESAKRYDWDKVASQIVKSYLEK